MIVLTKRVDVQGQESMKLSVIASAAGDLVWPRLVLKGIRDVSKKHFSSLEPGIKTGSFRFSFTESGFVNKDVFCKIILDLDEYLTVNHTPRPIFLLIDGATCHISLQARDLAKDREIMLWLLYPNSTHILQPLDLGLFGPVKNVFRRLVWDWHGNIANMNKSLTKYTSVPLIVQSLDTVLTRKGKNGIITGFLRSGVFPWNPEAVCFSTLKPSSKFQTDLSSKDVEVSTK